MSCTNENDERYPRDAEHRFRIYRLCDCPACEGTGKVWPTVPGEDGPVPVPLHRGDTRRCPLCRGEGKTRECIAATPDPEGLGVAIVHLGREGEFLDENGDPCPVGVLDVLAEPPTPKWVILPWKASPRNVSDAGRVLASARQK